MAEEHLTRAEFMAHMDPLRNDIRELVALQREVNGRTGKAETRIAVLEERNPPTRMENSVISAVISGVVSGLGVWFSHKP